MWRFNLVSFALLGIAFYFLSGGADYEPRTQSIQARAKLADTRPQARPVAETITELTASDAEPLPDETVSRSLVSLTDLDTSKDDEFTVTLASADAEATEEPVLNAAIEKSDTLTQTPEIAEGTLAEVVATQVAATQANVDMRRVTGSAVNLRDGPSTFYMAIGRLSNGAQVEVLESPGGGWLKIRATETGEIGWMADWLATAAAN